MGSTLNAYLSHCIFIELETYGTQRESYFQIPQFIKNIYKSFYQFTFHLLNSFIKEVICSE